MIALASVMLAGNAVAQSQSGMSTAAPLTNVKAFAELRSFGLCFARTQRKNALAVIATTPGSPEEHQLMQKVIYGEDRTTCLFGGTTLSMPPVFARGAIAEGLLQSEGVPDSYRLAAPLPSEVRDLHGVARCYVQTHRPQVQALLQTPAGSPAELAAVRAVWPEFSACMGRSGARLNAPWIRFLLAEALLRLAPATSTAGH